MISGGKIFLVFLQIDISHVFLINENGIQLDSNFIIIFQTNIYYDRRPTRNIQWPTGIEWITDNAKRVKTRTRNCTQFYDDYLPLKFSYLTRNDICKLRSTKHATRHVCRLKFACSNNRTLSRVWTTYHCLRCNAIPFDKDIPRSR